MEIGFHDVIIFYTMQFFSTAVPSTHNENKEAGKQPKLTFLNLNVSPESLYGIGGSRQGKNIPAGVGGETGFAVS
ncbi:MAG: hypothetical protein DSY32_00905 [Aquifex sp.]|nr:MAG: hypothetical protein DSY32_00905 [Aquifex sp.]